MLIRINGKPATMPDSKMTLEELVAGRGLSPERIVVELNLQIVSRAQWSLTIVQDNDQVEIVSFVGGG